MQTRWAWFSRACEIVNKRRQVAMRMAGLACLLVVAQVASAQDVAPPPQTPSPMVEAAHADEAHGDEAHGDEAHADAGHAADEHHGESPWVTLARVANFALLAGGLFYFLRGPIAAHLATRGEQIRGDLATAARVRAEAAQRLVDIETRLKELPAELDQVRARGAEEVAAEADRMAQQAEVERARLVAQVRREIDQQVRTARQGLTEHAAALSIGVAREHLRATLTSDDQRRLADVFTSQVGGAQ